MPDALEGCNVACNGDYYHDPAQRIEHQDLMRVYKVYHGRCHYEQKPVCPAHDTSVVPAKVQGLGLGTEVTGDKHSHYSNDPYLPLHMACKKNAANDYDISIAVYYVIDEISLWACGLKIPGHQTVDCVKYRVKGYHKSTNKN